MERALTKEEVRMRGALESTIQQIPQNDIAGILDDYANAARDGITATHEKSLLELKRKQPMPCLALINLYNNCLKAIRDKTFHKRRIDAAEKLLKGHILKDIPTKCHKLVKGNGKKVKLSDGTELVMLDLAEAPAAARAQDPAPAAAAADPAPTPAASSAAVSGDERANLRETATAAISLDNQGKSLYNQGEFIDAREKFINAVELYIIVAKILYSHEDEKFKTRGRAYHRRALELLDLADMATAAAAAPEGAPAAAAAAAPEGAKASVGGGKRKRKHKRTRKTHKLKRSKHKHIKHKKSHKRKKTLKRKYKNKSKKR